VGGVIALLLLAARENLRGLLGWVAAACFTGGAALTLFAYSTNFALSMVLVVIVGAGVVLTVNGVSTITMTIVDDAMRGRVMGFYSMAFLGMYPVGSLASGALADRIGATHTLAIGGTACMLCALWLWGRLPRLRHHMRPIYVKLGIINE
jgi:MFS family permease